MCTASVTTLAFTAGVGVIGLWIGEAVGYTVMVAGLFVFIKRVDWQEKAQEAKMRAAKDRSVVVMDESKSAGSAREEEQAQLLQDVPPSTVERPQ